MECLTSILVDKDKIERGAHLIPAGTWPPLPWAYYQGAFSGYDPHRNRRTISFDVDGLYVIVERIGEGQPQISAIFDFRRPSNAQLASYQEVQQEIT